MAETGIRIPLPRWSSNQARYCRQNRELQVRAAAETARRHTMPCLQGGADDKDSAAKRRKCQHRLGANKELIKTMKARALVYIRKVDGPPPT